jgi:hypothetical protein
MKLREHISTGLRRKFLTEDHPGVYVVKLALTAATLFCLGILPTFAELRSLNPGEVWQCPEVKPRSEHRPVIINPLEIPLAGPD